MTIRLFNTLSNTVEDLKPLDGETLRIYVCGPTVYDYGHIGNFRTFLQLDILRRFWKQQGNKIFHVMNITDVDDKIIRNAAAAHLEIEEYTKKYEQAFFQDLDALGCQRPEMVARATENIPQMVALIQRLAAKNLAYQAPDGSWYFRIAGFPEYGKLSKKDFSAITDGARVDLDEYDKDSARDFALWKAAKPGEKEWNTKLGCGRPGWHIECSAMALRYLGESFDLHAGGEDLTFPHHENEIAQSESATGKTMAYHWMHVRFLLVDGRKMSKSEGNFFTLRDLLLKGYKPSAIRFLLVSVPYRHPLNFTLEGLTESASAVDRVRTFAQRVRTGTWSPGLNPELEAQTAKAQQNFCAALSDDLNTSEARAAIFDLVRAGNIAADSGRLLAGNVPGITETLRRFDEVFAVLEDRDAEIARAALQWAHDEGRADEAAPELVAAYSISDQQVDALMAERERARRSRNFARADSIRNELAGYGIVIEDSKEGARWKRK
ncbi:MAG TPA: cysteine--tRNA ligase [Acidobacteriaceae bacterium]|nr:cysteine--tRNA ligase [Acidobacteriaceae bacterium]